MKERVKDSFLYIIHGLPSIQKEKWIFELPANVRQSWRHSKSSADCGDHEGIFLFLYLIAIPGRWIPLSEKSNILMFQGVAKNMGSVTKALEKAVNSMELEKITEVKA